MYKFTLSFLNSVRSWSTVPVRSIYHFHRKTIVHSTLYHQKSYKKCTISSKSHTPTILRPKIFLVSDKLEIEEIARTLILTATQPRCLFCAVRVIVNIYQCHSKVDRFLESFLIKSNRPVWRVQSTLARNIEFYLRKY